MKKLLIFCLVLFSLKCIAQTDYTPLGDKYSINGLVVPNFFAIPNDTFLVKGTVYENYPWLAAKGGIIYRWSTTLLHWVQMGDVGTITWGPGIIGNLTDQHDLDSALQTKQGLLPVGLNTQYWDATGGLQTLSTKVTSITDPLYVPKGDTIKFILKTDTLRFHNPLFKSGTNDVYIDGSVAAYNSAWTAGFPNKISQPTADGQVWTANTNAGYAEWQTPTTGISQDDADGRYYPVSTNPSNYYKPSDTTSTLSTKGYALNLYNVLNGSKKDKSDSTANSGYTTVYQNSLKETSFTETIQEFTGSTSATVTVSNSPKSSKAIVVFFNGIAVTNSNLSITGAAITISGVTRETTDIIKVKYSY